MDSKSTINGTVQNLESSITTVENLKKISLAERLAAVDDRDASDEVRFWAAVKVLTDAGLPRSQMVKLAKLTDDFDDCLAVLRDVAAGRKPGAYLAAIVQTRTQRQAATTGDLAAMAGLPEIVRQYMRRGWHVQKLGDDEWRCGAVIYNGKGEEVGG